MKFLATPFGLVPVLYVDGDKFVLPETLAIYRYLAAKHGALPDSLEDQAVANAYGDHIQDWMSKLNLFVGAIFSKKPREQILEYRADFVNFFRDRMVPDLKKQLEKNGTGWVIGNKPTWIDFMLADVIDEHLYWREENDDELLGEILKHHDRVFGLPGLEERIKERKQLFPPKDTFKY